MKHPAKDAAHSRRGGINRLTAILLALIAVMLALIAVPGWRAFRYRSAKNACVQAMKSARDGLIIEFLANWDGSTATEAMRTLDEVMPGRADLCPSGGTVYLVRNDIGIFEPVCGLHDDDAALRTRLNASRAQELLADALRLARRDSEEEPERVEIRLNGAALECVRVQEEPALQRGTATTNGYEGVVCFYGLAGDGAFAPEDVEAGEVCYLLYADADHCAIWHADDGWTGDAY